MGAIGILEPSSGDDNAGHSSNDSLTNNRLIAFEILSVILQLLSIVFNGAIICTLSRRSLLKYPSNRFVFSLCTSHLFVSFLSVSISLITTFIPSSPSSVLLSSFKTTHPQHAFEEGHGLAMQTTRGGSGVPQCGNAGVDLAHLIVMHLNFGVAVCTSITVALISVERYITIARPMRYKSIVTARRSLYAIICCWLLTALITMMPLLLFENRDVCGTFSVPMESLATYFGVVFAVVTVFALAVMIVCYTHIFRIAKAKCQKVQIGHFTASTVSSISSDWPSSIYSSAQGQNRFLHAGSRIDSSNSLLVQCLMSNLGRYAHPLRVPKALRGGVPLTPPATPTLPPKNAFFSESALNSRRESDETTTTGASTSRNGSTTSSNSGGGGAGHQNPTSNYLIDPSRSPLYQYHHFTPPRKLRNRWKTYLQPNYNSPRKTIFTIVLLIGSVLFTQLPLSFVLFTSTFEATQRWFQFCTTVLFSTSSVANPVLYGFLNRSIRDQLWRILKRKSRHAGEHGPSASTLRKRKRGQQQQLDEIAQNSKGFLSTANHCHLQDLCRNVNNGVIREIPAIKISRRESISSDDNSSVHSVASTNSINAIGTTTKAKINQVQKRNAGASSPSPYYRSVLLKKASINLSKSNSLLPRLALPDVNIRRNSSGSIISIRNGVMSKMIKGKSKEMNERRISKEEGDVDTTIARQNTSGEDGVIAVEMQTFRNYSTPDLPLSLASSSTRNEPNEEVEVVDGSPKSIDNGKDELVAIEIETTFENKLDHENQVQPSLKNDGETSGNENVDSTCHEDAKSERTIHRLEVDMHLEPGPSNSTNDDSEDGKSSSTRKLEACLSVESLMGVVIDEELLPDNFPRKPSQDSGADMSFSDEEEELPAIPSYSVLQHASSTPLLSSLPAGTVAMILRTGGAVNEHPRMNSALSSPSLFGPFLLVGHHSEDNGGNSEALHDNDVVLLPHSCSNEESISGSEEDEEGPGKRSNRAGVTVTITDSNSDTQLYNPHVGNNHNNSLLRVESNMFCHQHTIQHHSHCLLGRAMTKHHKSKSESDICTANQIQPVRDADVDLRVRSNCDINYLVINSCNKSNLSSDNLNQLSINNDAFTLICCDCDNCPSCNGREVRKVGNSKSCCSLWANTSGNNKDDKCQLPLLPTSGSMGSISQKHYVLRSNNVSGGGSHPNLVGPVSQSPQWLSVMSVNSSCSSLSSTCPLRILDEHHKSDVSDYDDFEDPIEI